MVDCSTPPGPEPITIQQQVTRGDSELVSYWMAVGAEGVSVHIGAAESPTVTFELLEALAAEIHAGDRSALNAFLDGELTLTGDVGALTRASKALGGNDPFSEVRVRTRY